MTPRVLITSGFLLLAGLGLPGDSSAPDPPDKPAVHCDADVSFGRQAAFSLREYGTAVRGSLAVRSMGNETVYPAEIMPTEGGIFRVQRDLAAQPFFPFSEVSYEWSVEESCGAVQVLPECRFTYEDTRYVWLRRETETRGVDIYLPDDAEREVVEAARIFHLGLQNAAGDFSISEPQPVRLYWYPSVREMQAGLGNLANGWEGAVSNLPESIILFASSGGLEGRKTLAVLLPHEAAHLVLEKFLDHRSARLPMWLAEGIAVHYEFEPRAELDGALRDALSRNSLLEIETLCYAFPSGEKAALLAYAESRSFVEYLIAHYGKASLVRSVETYGQGAGCREGFESVYGIPLQKASLAWRDWLVHDTDSSGTVFSFLLAGIGGLITILLLGVLLARTRKREVERAESEV